MVNRLFNTKMLFTKADLLYTYNWKSPDTEQPELTAGPARTLLNRNEGYEVLFVICRLMADWGLKQKTSGQKLERLINIYPAYLKSFPAIKKWILENWNLQ